MKAPLFTIDRKTLAFPLYFFGGFVLIAVWRWWATGSVFYLFNFPYIGGSIALGMFLNDNLAKPYRPWGRRLAQLLIGGYMLGFLGFYTRENMQLEGFFFYLFQGLFVGASLHYFIAKLVGPVLFGRGWCGWACWTAMILDLLPWQRPAQGRVPRAGALRYLHFALALGVVSLLFFVFGYAPAKQGPTELYWLAVGNAVYYAVALILAASLKDNRAFCKYVCPIPTTQKVGARFAVMKVAIDQAKCIRCGLCEKNCPMNIKLLEYADARQRILSTECVMCLTCANVCPKDAITANMGFDGGWRERLTYRDVFPANRSAAR